MNASYKDKLIYTLIGELSSKSDSSTLDPSAESIVLWNSPSMPGVITIKSDNSLFTLLSIYCVFEEPVEERPIVEFYENNVVLGEFTLEATHGYALPQCKFSCDLGGLTANQVHLKRGSNTYCVKDKKTGACSNNLKVRVKLYGQEYFIFLSSLKCSRLAKNTHLKRITLFSI